MFPLFGLLIFGMFVLAGFTSGRILIMSGFTSGRMLILSSFGLYLLFQSSNKLSVKIKEDKLFVLV